MFTHLLRLCRYLASLLPRPAGPARGHRCPAPAPIDNAGRAEAILQAFSRPAGRWPRRSSRACC